LPDVGHDADDLARDRLVVADCEGTANGIVVAEPGARQRLVDHDDGGGVTPVPPVEGATAQQPDAHRLEVSGRDDAEVADRTAR